MSFLSLTLGRYVRGGVSNELRGPSVMLLGVISGRASDLNVLLRVIRRFGGWFPSAPVGLMEPDIPISFECSGLVDSIS